MPFSSLPYVPYGIYFEIIRYVYTRASQTNQGIIMNIINSFSLYKLAQISTLGIMSLTVITNVSANQLIPLESYWSKQRGDNVTCGTEKCHQAVLNTGGYRYLRVEGCASNAQVPGTIPLVLYWHSGRKDNVTVASSKSRAEQVNTGGYRYVRVEGYIYKQQQKGTVPLKLYWYAKRSDNATVASEEGIADQENTKGMSFIRTEGYVYPASNCM
jgi:hypothetical protein